MGCTGGDWLKAYDNGIKSSGDKEKFATGSVRDNPAGKIRPDLIPHFVKAILGRHYADGARHYGDRNWEKGQPITRYVESFERHWTAWCCGITDENHLSAAIWNLVGIMFTLAMVKAGLLPAELDDRPVHMKPDNPVGKMVWDEYVDVKKREE